MSEEREEPDEPREGMPYRLPSFDGFPYLVSQLGSSAHHTMLLPASWEVPELVNFARRQTDVNKIPAALVLNSTTCAYFWPDREILWDTKFPWCQSPVTRKLRPNVPIPHSDELLERQVRLDNLTINTKFDRGLLKEYSVRRTTKADRKFLDGVQPNGVPVGLSPCPKCEAWCGECLLPPAGHQHAIVQCLCVNDSLCAGCLEPFSNYQLTANYFDPRDNTIFPVPGILALTHVCELTM